MVNIEYLSIEKFTDLINEKRCRLYGDSYEFAMSFINKLYAFIKENSLFDKSLDSLYFGVQIDNIVGEDIIINEDFFWSLSKEDFFETREELIKFDYIREDLEMYFNNHNKSLYDLEYSACKWGIFFKLLEKNGFMPYLKRTYPKNRNIIKDLKLVVFFKCNF